MTAQTAKLPSLRRLMDAGQKRIAELIGDAAACELSVHFAGERLFIAKDPPPESRLVRVLGLPAAQQLASVYGGDYLDIPVAIRACACYLDRRGVERNEIARLLRSGRNTISEICNRFNGAKKDLTPQLDLFAEKAR